MGPSTRQKSKSCEEASRHIPESQREKIKNGKRNWKQERHKVKLDCNAPFVVLERIDPLLSNNILCNRRVALGDKTNTDLISSKTIPKSSVDGLRNRNSPKDIGMDSSPFEERPTRQSPRIFAPRRVQGSSSGTPSRGKGDLKSKDDSSCSSVQSTSKAANLCDKINNAASRNSLSGSTPTGNFDINKSPSTTPGSRLRNKNRKLANESSLKIKRSLISEIGKESVASTKLKLSEEKTVLSGDNVESNILPSNNICVYSKVTRDTLNNKNMPPERKLALYEFEVDENEPVVNKKKRRKVYLKQRRKPVVGNKKYHSVTKNPAPKLESKSLATCTSHEKSSNNLACVKELQYSLQIPMEKTEKSAERCFQKVKENSTEMHMITVEESIEERKKVTKTVHDIHCEKHVHFEEVMETEDYLKDQMLGVDSSKVAEACPIPLSVENQEPLLPASPMPLVESQTSNIQTPKSANSKPGRQMRKRYYKDNQENMSPIARPQRRRTPMRKLTTFNQVDSSMCESSVKEKVEQSQLESITNSVKRDVISQEVLEPSNEEKDCHPENACNISTASDSVPSVIGHSTPAKLNSPSTIVDLESERDLLSPIPVTRSPNFSPYKGHKTGSTANSSLNCRASYQSIPLLKKVFLLPRVSGGGNSMPEKEKDNKWDVKNCFGFEDECEEPELNSTSKIISVDKSTKSGTSIGTPTVSSSKPSLIRASIKRKLDIVSENIPCKSPRLLESKENTISTSCPALPHSSASSPFANPLKQSKLDFSLVSPKTPIAKDESLTKNESPALFKDDDQTPTHFTEPPRRSYNRSHRKKLQYVGDEWIEVEEDEHTDDEKSKSKRIKKHKRTKQEEKEAQKWIKNFNNQCEEVEDFELCVE